MTPVLTAAEMRVAEQRLFDAGLSVDALMARAGEGVAEAAWRFAGGAPTLILCGPGNNGGDGYVAAGVLRDRGVRVSVTAFDAPHSPAAIAARALWGGPVDTPTDADPRALFIDALFGTGLARALEPAAEEALARLSGAASLRIAVDVPSGLGSDDGVALSPVPAMDLTVALGALKPVHLLAPSAERCGRVALVDLGIDAGAARLHRIDRPRLAAPGAATHKYSRGMVLVVGGAMPGAAMLAAAAALRGGAGYVLVAGGDPARGPAAIVHRPAASLTDALADDRVGAVLVGPGLGRDAAASARLDAVLAGSRPLVIDADALTLLAGRGDGPGLLAGRGQAMILTPHAGEFAQLFGDVAGSPVDAARAAAARSGAVVVTKSAATIVAAPDGRAAIAPLAPGWLATAGTGDVLAGLCAARLAAGAAPFEAACEAVWLHGEAARRAGPALIADDLARHLPQAIGACL